MTLWRCKSACCEWDAAPCRRRWWPPWRMNWTWGVSSSASWCPTLTRKAGHELVSTAPDFDQHRTSLGCSLLHPMLVSWARHFIAMHGYSCSAGMSERELQAEQVKAIRKLLCRLEDFGNCVAAAETPRRGAQVCSASSTDKAVALYALGYRGGCYTETANCVPA